METRKGKEIYWYYSLLHKYNEYHKVKIFIFLLFILARMTGHQQLINDVKFSPDGRIIASASFDKSIKLWESNTGKYITSLRGHVQAVYSISWSADSRLLVSSSADSTLKRKQIISNMLIWTSICY